MSRPNTSYGIRVPSDDEVREAFGSLAHAAQVTGGDLHTLLFFLHNRDRIDTASLVPPQSGEFATDFIERANVERAAGAFEGMEKPKIAAVAREIGVCRQVARRLLTKAGKVAA